MFTDQQTVDVLRDAFRMVKAQRPFQLGAIVVLPDHLHCTWTLPAGDADYASRWRLVKTWFTKHWSGVPAAEPDPARRARGEQALWQHRYWEHVIRDDEDLSRHVDYIHYNPVKHGLVKAAADWPYSSFRHYVALGLYPMDWGCGHLDFEGVGRE